MKTAVIGEDAEGLVRYNRSLLDVARHYGCQSARKRDPGSACKRDPLLVCTDAPGLAGAEP
jgi:hypothetical protein